MSTPTIYVASSLTFSLIIVGAFAVVLIVVVCVCGVINLVARRPVVNGWLWGAVVVAVVGVRLMYKLLLVSGSPDPRIGEPGSGPGAEVIEIPVGLALLLGAAGWRAVRWHRRRRTA